MSSSTRNIKTRMYEYHDHVILLVTCPCLLRDRSSTRVPTSPSVLHTTLGAAQQNVKCITLTTTVLGTTTRPFTLPSTTHVTPSLHSSTGNGLCQLLERNSWQSKRGQSPVVVSKSKPAAHPSFQLFDITTALFHQNHVQSRPISSSWSSINSSQDARLSKTAEMEPGFRKSDWKSRVSSSRSRGRTWGMSAFGSPGLRR